MFNNSSEIFMDAWNSYLINIEEKIIKRQIVFLEQNGLVGKETNSSGEILKGLAEAVISELKSDMCQNVMKEVVKDCHPKAVQFISKELQFFNILASEINSDEKKTAKDKFALNSACIVKTSIEEIFHLPHWLKSILHVLNELLEILGFGFA